MNRSTIGIIVFCVFLGTNAAGSTVFFLDSISIPGAKCKISIPDSNLMFSSFQHPCNSYFFFQYNTKSFRYSTPIVIDFSSSVKCTLFVKQATLYRLASNTVDTLPISCDSLKYIENIYLNGYSGRVSLIATTGKLSLDWGYALPVKRLATANPLLYDNLHFVLKSVADSSELFLSRTGPHFTHVNTPRCKATNNPKFIQKAYTVNGELIQTNRRLPSVYILKDNATTKSMVHLRNPSVTP